MNEPEPLEQRVAALESELAGMRATLGALEAWAVRYGVVIPGRAPTPTPAAPAAAQATAAQAATAETPPPAARTPLSGEQLLVRTMYGVGLVVLLVGGAIFLPSLALLGAPVRTLLGITIGVVLIGVGVRAPARTWQADGLLALGAGFEYLTLWYARDVHMIPGAIAALAMFATTGMLYAQAYVHRSERIGFAGLLGGFLTPALLASEHPDRLGLNVYLLVLSAAALGLGITRRFRYVEFATFFFVALYATQWATTFDVSWTPIGAIVAATLYFALFVGALLYGVRDGDASLGRRVLLSLELWAFAAFLEGQFQNTNLPDAVTYRVAMLVFAVGMLAAARAPTVAVNLRLIFAGWAAGAVMLSLQAALAPQYEAGGWAVEGALLSAIATGGGDKATWSRVGSGLLFFVAFVLASLQWSTSWNFFSGSERQPVLNPTIAQLTGVALALWAALEFERRAPVKLWLNVLRVALHATVAFALGFESYIVFAGQESGQLAATFALTVYAAGLVAAGVREHRGLLRGMGVALFAFVVLKIFSVDLSGVDALVRFLSFVAVGVVLVVVATWYSRALASQSTGSDETDTA